MHEVTAVPVTISVVCASMLGIDYAGGATKHESPGV